MSKKSKEKARLERRKGKAAKKRAAQAKYEGYRDAGITKATRRSRMQKSKGKARLRGRSAERIAFPYHLWLKKDGTYRSMPAWAWKLRPEAQAALARVGSMAS